MFKAILLFCLIVLRVHFSFSQNQEYPQDYFIPPMDIPLYLSGTFGELRGNHFHSGIDIKTNGREGQPVKAAADGVIYRIKVSPYGFGKALYVRHPNGFSTVYAHLQRFNEQIETYVKEEQYRQRSFAVELYPPSDKFQMAKGEVIALSGNSGGSGGPHLHFEIRDTRTEKIINPLLFGYNVKDTQHPDLYDLTLYEFNKNDLIASENFRLIEVSNGEYRIAGNDMLEIQGTPAFGISTFDRLDGAPNKNGVYQIKMWIGGEEYYDFTMETFAFDETRYINSHIDYGQKVCCRKVVNRLYIQPNNRLSVYGVRKKMNIPDLVPDNVYDVKIEVRDVAGNMATLIFNMRKSSSGFLAGDIPQIDLPVFKYAQTNFFKNDDVELVLPEGALYQDIYFEYQEKSPCFQCLSPVYTFGAREIPVHQYYTIRIKPSPAYTGDKNKLAIASLQNGRIDDYEGGKWENGYVVGKTRQFGDFTVVADSIPPVISPVNFTSGKNVSAQKFLRIKITDNFSGIDTYAAEIDGTWVLMEYDAKYNLLILDTDYLALKPGEHTLYLNVTDEMGNKSVATYKLIF